MTFSKRLLVLFIGFSFANLGFSKSKECSKIEIDRASIALEFTAYKFSEKAGVGGKFKKFETLQSKNQAASLDEWGTLFDGIEISTKVLSLETGDKSRDLKIINAFFGNMSDQRKIEGVLSELKMKKDSNSEYSAKLTMKMNGVSRVYENVALKREKDKVKLHQEIDVVEHFKAGKALKALHNLCKSLHTGKDGVAKTWPTVLLRLSANLKCAQ